MTMKISLVALLIAACALAGESVGSASPDRRLARLASERLGRDFRIRFTLRKDARLCGGEGDAYVGRVQVNRYRRGYTASGQAKVTDRWVEIDKTYYVFVEDLDGPRPQLSDADQCME
jgi:hypothetical protein